MKKQTAVEWLEMEIVELEINYEIPNRLYEFLEIAKQMEKEQIIDFAEFVETYPDKNKNADGDMLHAKSKYDGAERTIDLLKEYYKL